MHNSKVTNSIFFSFHSRLFLNLEITISIWILQVATATMKLLCSNFVVSYPGSKDDVDNRTNDSVTIKDNSNLSASAPVSPNNTSPATATPANANSPMSASDLCREEQRLKTFDQRWPHTFLDPRILAKTGFYYIGPQDQVKCYFCKVEVGRWENGDNEVSEHSRWSPNCPLLKRRETTNVPIEPTTELDQLLPPMSYDVCGPCGIGIRPGTFPDIPYESDPNAPADVPPTTTNTTVERETQTLKHPDYPEYAIETARLRSFDEWPKTMKQKPKQLTDAGFFYTQKGDRVICFSCGGGLRDWDEHDEPWEQHAMWYSKCDYLKLMKGQEYIDAVKAKFSKAESQENSGLLSSSSSQESAASSFGSSSSSSSSSSSTPVLAHASSGDLDDPNSDNKLCESRLCKICYSSEYNTAFFPCGHVIACTKCASSVTKCPLCRKPFERVMRVFFS